MSFSNNPQNPNTPSDPDFPDSDSPDDSIDSVDSVDEDDDVYFEEAPPLPAFDPTKSEAEAPLKPLAETLPELEAILKNQYPALPPPKHVYQISSAEPSWSEYPPPLEEEQDDEAPDETPSGWQTTWAVLREVGETVLLTLVIFLLIQTVIRNFRVVGTSMVDNLHNGQYLIIDKLTYSKPFAALGWGGPQYGDVVVFEPPTHPDDDYVKRIVGLPGDTVKVENGQVWINGEILPEPFLPKIPRYVLPETTVPEGHVYVLGDNRNNSNDSHNWGPLPIENIVGRAWISYWPPEQWGTIPRDAPSSQATLKYLLNDVVPNANADTQ